LSCPAEPSADPGVSGAAYLDASLQRTLGGSSKLAAATQVRRAIGLHPGVWRIELSDGRRLAAKRFPLAALVRGRPFDPLTVEPEVYRRLEGCPVAPVLGVDVDGCVIFYEWCGDETLDDVCQLEAPSAHRGSAERVTEGFSLIRTGFALHSDGLAPMTFPGCGMADLLEGWEKACGELLGDLPLVASRYGLSDKTTGRLSHEVARLGRVLAGSSPALGVTDYNARNVVLDRGADRLRFIEFAKIGWDWDERRLVQYTTGMGGGLAQGRFRSLLTPDLVRAASDSVAMAHRLDGHHLIFHLLAACRLCRAITETTRSGGNTELLRFWREPEPRLLQLRTILAEPLSLNPLVSGIRATFAQGIERSP
jgi:hypothetical protein